MMNVDNVSNVDNVDPPNIIQTTNHGKDSNSSLYQLNNELMIGLANFQFDNCLSTYPSYLQMLHAFGLGSGWYSISIVHRRAILHYLVCSIGECNPFVCCIQECTECRLCGEAMEYCIDKVLLHFVNECSKYHCCGCAKHFNLIQFAQHLLSGSCLNILIKCPWYEYRITLTQLSTGDCNNIFLHFQNQCTWTGSIYDLNHHLDHSLCGITLSESMSKQRMSLLPEPTHFPQSISLINESHQTPANLQISETVSKLGCKQPNSCSESSDNNSIKKAKLITPTFKDLVIGPYKIDFVFDSGKHWFYFEDLINCLFQKAISERDQRRWRAIIQREIKLASSLIKSGLIAFRVAGAPNLREYWGISSDLRHMIDALKPHLHSADALHIANQLQSEWVKQTENKTVFTLGSKD